jgi:hypothetical protein
LSSVLVIQNKNNIYIGSDTAISTDLNGKYYRVNDCGEKLFCIDNKVIFCSGDLSLSYSIINTYKNSNNYTIDNLYNIIKQKYKNEYCLDVLVASIENGLSVLYQISPYNNFEIIKKQIDNSNDFAIWTGGIKTKECYNSAYNYILKRNTIEKVYYNTFSEISCECVGGNLILYKLNKEGIKQLLNVKINENPNIHYISELIGNLSLVIAERLIGQIIMGSNVYIEDENGKLNITGDLLTVYDGATPTPNVRVKLGQYDTGKYGLYLRNKTGDTTILNEDGIMQSWGDSISDSVDSTHKLRMDFYVPDNMVSIKMFKLFFRLLPYRAYSTGATSGGGTTTSNGGGDIFTSGNQMEDFETWYTLSNGLHTHGGSTGTDHHSHYHHEHDDYNTDSDEYSHYHTINYDGVHQHEMLILGSHKHQITLTDHNHTVGNHTHNITYGIYESTLATGVKVYIDGTLRLDNGGSGYTTDQANLDLSSWITTSGWHYLELSSSQLGRLSAAYFTQMFLSM